MQDIPAATLARPVRRQRAAPGVVGGGAAPSASGPSPTAASAGGGGGAAATVMSAAATAKELLGGGASDDHYSGGGGYADSNSSGGGGGGGLVAGAAASSAMPTTTTAITAANAATIALATQVLGPDAYQYASLISAVVPVKTSTSSANNTVGGGAAALANQHQLHQQQFNVYFSVPTAQTTVDEIIKARLVQNAPKYLSSFSGGYSSLGGVDTEGGDCSSLSETNATQQQQQAGQQQRDVSGANNNTNNHNSSGAGGGGGGISRTATVGSLNNNSSAPTSPNASRGGVFPSSSAANSSGGGGGGASAGHDFNGQNNKGSSSSANNNNNDSLVSAEAIRVYYSTPVAALASGFLESPTFGGGSVVLSISSPTSSSGGGGSHYNHLSHHSNALLDMNNTYDLLMSSASSSSTTMKREDIERENKNWVKAQQGRVKTTQGVLIVNLRIGCDPPDSERIEPCAKLECWLDPKTMQAKYQNKGAEKITDVLEAQYKGLHRDVMFKRAVEGSMEDAKHAMLSARRKAKKDNRVLIHFNGHGTPKATQYGEVWFTGKDHFYPMPIYDICAAVESPAIYVFDCNSAGSLLNTWRVSGMMNGSNDIFLCACSEGEMLPVNALLPADLLTSCLTTPLTIALEWYINYSNRDLLLPNVTPEMIRHLPGDANNRRTPLGELNVILGSILDSIAWCTMPREAYYPVLRNDQLVRNLFRNFFLADKLIREVGCVPVSHPPVPEAAHSHHLWAAWDVVLESVLAQLPDMLNPDLTLRADYHYQPTRYFTDQLNAFDVWIDVDDKGATRSPEQLPALMVCLSHTTHRMRALLLLCKYLNTGPSAVHAVLYCGLGNLITRFLGHAELRLALIVVWQLIIRVDPIWATTELGRIGAEQFFIRFMFSKGNAFKLLTGHETAAAEAAAAAAAVAAQQAKVVAEAGFQLQSTFPPVIPIPMSSSSPTSGGEQKPTAAIAAAPAYVPMSRTMQPSSSSAGLDGLGGDGAAPSNNAAAGNSNSNANANANNSGNGNNTNSEPQLPSFCALPGMTMDRCRAISCFMLCRMITVQQQQAMAQLRAQHQQQNSASSAAALLHALQFPPATVSAMQIWNNTGLAAGIQLATSSSSSSSSQQIASSSSNAEAIEVKSWALLFLSKLVDSLRCAKECLLKELTRRRDLLYPLLDHPSPTVRASCVMLFGSLLGTRIDVIKDPQEQDRRCELDKYILQFLSQHIADPSRDVRIELTVAAGRIVAAYYPLIKIARAQSLLPKSFNGTEEPLLLLSSPAGGSNANMDGNSDNLSVAASSAGVGVHHHHGGGSSAHLGALGAPSSTSQQHHHQTSSSLSAVSGSSGVVPPSSSNNNNNNNSAAAPSAVNGSNNNNSSSSSSSAAYVTEDLSQMRHRSLMVAERDVGVASALHKSSVSNTDPNAAAFSQTSILTKDDAPITAPWSLKTLSRYHLNTVESLVHDALVIIARMAYGCDNGVARRARSVFATVCNPHPLQLQLTNNSNNNSANSASSPSSSDAAAANPNIIMLPRPMSSRIQHEGDLTMRGISSDATPSLSESDRVRDRRNADLMRQVVLDLRPNRCVFLPATASNNNANNSNSSNTSNSNAGASGAAVGTPVTEAAGSFPTSANATRSSQAAGSPTALNGSGSSHSNHHGNSSNAADFGGAGALDACFDVPKPHHRIQHILPLPGHAPIVSHQFRNLEPHVITVEKNNRISIVSYEDPSHIQLLESFQHCRRDPITSGLIVNDLSDCPAYMVVDKAGVFTFYNNLLNGGRPAVVSAFNAATGEKAGRHPPPQTYLENDVVCAYRPFDSILLYGSGTGGIHLLSVADEQLVQSIGTSGDGAISSIFVQGHGGRIVIAGFTDGIVRNYDDRVRGYTSCYASWETKPAATRTAYDSVVGVGFSGENSVYAATRNSIILFDVRQSQRPLKTVDTIPSVTTGGGGGGSLLKGGAAGGGGAAAGGPIANKQFVSSFSMCSHFGLMATMTTEGVCDIYDARLESLLVCGLPVNLNHTYYNTVLQNAAANPPIVHPSHQYNLPAPVLATASSTTSSSADHPQRQQQQCYQQQNLTPQQKAQDYAIAYSSTTVVPSSNNNNGTNSAGYKPLRLRWENTVNNVTFHPMRPMALFGNELVTLLQTNVNK